MTARKVTLCVHCRETQGFIYDESTDPPTVTRCPCRDERKTAAQARDEAIQAAGMSNEQAFRTAYRIIADEAQISQWLSANTIRTAIETAQIPGPVVGAAFRKAADEGLIEPDGYVASTQLTTHAHKIIQWRSRVYARQLGVV